MDYGNFDRWFQRSFENYLNKNEDITSVSQDFTSRLVAFKSWTNMKLPVYLICLIWTELETTNRWTQPTITN